MPRSFRKVFASPLKACTWQSASRSSPEAPLAKVMVWMRDLVNRFFSELGSLSAESSGVLLMSSLSLSSVMEKSAAQGPEILASRASLERASLPGDGPEGLSAPARG